MASILVGNKSVPVSVNKKGIVTVPGWARSMGSGRASASQAYDESAIANRCIEIRANTLASIPWRVKASRDGDEVGEEHPLHVLLSQVNPEMNTQDLFRFTEADLLIYGKALWLKVPGSDGNTTGFLQRINPRDIKLIRSKEGELLGFRRQHSSENRTTEVYQREECVFFHEYNPNDDFEGTSKSAVAGRSIGMEVNVEQYGVDFFDNYAMPAVLLESKQTVTEATFNRVQRWWRRIFGGRGNRHKVGVVDSGLSANVIGAPLKDLAIGDVRAESRRSICSAYGVPPSLAGAWEAANYATMEVQRESLYQDTLIPRAMYMQGVIQAELADEFGVWFEFAFDELPIMKPDEQVERSSMIELVKAGIITVAAAAERLGIRPDEVGDGPQQAPSPFMFQQPGQDRGRGQDEAEDEDEDEELSKMGRKAKKAIKAGKSAAVPFRSEVLSGALISAIGRSLEAAKTVEDVDTIIDTFRSE